MRMSGLLFAIFGYERKHFHICLNHENIIVTSYDMSVRNKFPKTYIQELKRTAVKKFV